jgi:hypothetical protein
VSGGAWPFLVGGVICLVNYVKERDLNLLNSHVNPGLSSSFFSTQARGGRKPLLLVLFMGVSSNGEDLIVFLEAS